MQARKLSGFTLIELIITVIIIGVLAALALPSFYKFLERNKIQQAAEGFASDVYLARTEAIKQSCATDIDITTGSNWQYVFTPCTGSTKTVTKTSDLVTLSASTFPSNKITSDFRRGDVTNGSVTFTTADYQLRVQIQNGHQVRICSPVSSQAVSAYKGCS